MPELPEVETIRMQLTKYLVGPPGGEASHKIVTIEVKNRRVFQGDEKKIVGAKFIKIRRFGKVLVMDLSNGMSLVSHIKLTGQYVYRGPNLKHPKPISKKVAGGAPGPHTHVIFNLDKNGKLYYNDIRRFGWIKTVNSAKLKVDSEFIAKLGPEPLKDLTLKKFIEILLKTRRAVKVVIMDQSKMGGVGNIYANDALWLAKIDPKRPANSLKATEIKALYEAIETVLKTGLKYGGASELAFVTPDGEEGEYQNHSLAYGMTGKLCPRCKKEKFKKFMLSGRGTYVCEHCQK